MSANSIIEQSIENYQILFEDKLKKQANTVWLKNNYAINGEINYLELRHNLNFSRIMCTDDCTLVNYINKKIANKLKIPCRKRLCDTIDDYKKRCYKKMSCEEIEQQCLTDIGITQF